MVLILDDFSRDRTVLDFERERRSIFFKWKPPTKIIPIDSEKKEKSD